MIPICVDDKVANSPVPTLQPLRNHLQLIQRLVKLECLLPWLYQESVLNDEEIEGLHSKPSHGCKVMVLVQAIEKKGKTGIRGLVYCLENEKDHVGHEELAEELKKGDLNIVERF